MIGTNTPADRSQYIDTDSSEVYRLWGDIGLIIEHLLLRHASVLPSKTGLAAQQDFETEDEITRHIEGGTHCRLP
jgi:hypothetical protein